MYTCRLVIVSRYLKETICTYIKEDIVWFQKFASERSANNAYAVKWVVPLNRLSITPVTPAQWKTIVTLLKE